MTISYKELATKGVQGLTPYQPGKPIEELERELGISDSLKLASNENPLGPSHKVQDVLKQNLSSLHLYPDGSAHLLRQRLAQEHQLLMSQITLGNGSNDVLELVARAYLTDKDSAVFSEYAFAVYPIVTQAIGARAIVAKAYPAEHEEMPYGHDLKAIADAVDATTKVIFLANPNNPTGTWIEPAALYEFFNKISESVIIVLDEAYFEYMPKTLQPESVKWLAEFPNLIITRTFSKIHALAGLRVGYAASGEAIADMLNRVRQPFNVNTLAQLAACAALDDQEHITKSVFMNSFSLRLLLRGLDDLNLDYIPTIGNFITVDFKREAATIYSALLHQGVIVRPLANYGLPNHLRITIGSKQQVERALMALDIVLNDPQAAGI
ncbi:MAG: histidinol-phosphate transaminase [Gammaproteobacteria bacterium]|nr:histidinol-phosphate transaminase [Gammaproteobacteria bacterium]